MNKRIFVYRPNKAKDRQQAKARGVAFDVGIATSESARETIYHAVAQMSGCFGEPVMLFEEEVRNGQ